LAVWQRTARAEGFTALGEKHVRGAVEIIDVSAPAVLLPGRGPQSAGGSSVVCLTFCYAEDHGLAIRHAIKRIKDNLE
jgi:hypothetical protein